MKIEIKKKREEITPKNVCLDDAKREVAFRT